MEGRYLEYGDFPSCWPRLSCTPRSGCILAIGSILAAARSSSAEVGGVGANVAFPHGAHILKFFQVTKRGVEIGRL